MGARALALRDWLGPPLLAGAAVTAAALLGLLAVIEPLAALGLTLAMAFVAISLASLAAGVCMLTVITFFDNLPGIQGATLSPAKIAGAILVVAWLLAISNRDQPTAFLARDRPFLAYAAAALVALAFASRLWATDGSAADSNAFRLALSVVLVFVVFSAVREPRDFRWIAWSFVGGAFLSAVVGLTTTSPEAGTAAAQEGRLAGGIADPNELAGILVPALVLAAFGLAAVKSALGRWALMVCVITFAICLFLTESRGGLVALVVVLVASIALAGRHRPQAVVLGLVVAGLGVGYYSLFASHEALQRLTEFFAGGGTGRTDLWAVALEIIGDHVVLGVGAGNFQIVEPAYATGTISLSSVNFIVDTPKVAHNTYLEVLAELGIVGLLAFAGLVLGCLSRLPSAIRSFARAGDLGDEALARGLFVGLLGMLAAYVFISGQYEKQLWLLLGLAAALGSVTTAGRATERRE